MSAPSALDLIRRTATHALQAAGTLVTEWLPEGSLKGREWVALNPVRGDRNAGSFGVSLESGRWHDFADDTAHGGDLVSLLAYLQNIRQVEAAQLIDKRLGLGLFQGKTESTTTLSSQEREQAEKVREQALQQQQIALQAKHRDAALQAAKLWGMAKPAEANQPYLAAKGVSPYRLRQLRQGRLLVPLIQDDHLVNLQIIEAGGTKRFLTGGKVKGCYSPIGDFASITGGSRLYLCEGWATGATLHANTGDPVACAMYAGNLKPVALSLREKFGPGLDLVIAGDDDRQTLGNPGRLMANQAAVATDARVVFPQWPIDAPGHLSDFNDLYQWLASQQQGSQAQ